MNKIDWKNYFRNNSLLSNLKVVEVQTLLDLKVSKEIEVEKDQVVIPAGKPEDSMFLIGSGSVSVKYFDDNGPNIPLFTLHKHKGDFLGEIDPGENKTYAKTIIADESCILLELKRDDFLKLLHSHPDIHEKVSAKLRELPQKFPKRPLADFDDKLTLDHSGKVPTQTNVSSGPQESQNDHDAPRIPTSLWSVFATVYNWVFKSPPLLGGIVLVSLCAIILPVAAPYKYAKFLELAVSKEYYDKLKKVYTEPYEKKLTKAQKSLTVAGEKIQSLTTELENHMTINANVEVKPIRVKALFATSITEAWVGAIHKALKRARDREGEEITYEWVEGIEASDMDDRARQAVEDGYDLIIGDAFVAEHPLRAVASEYVGRRTAFVFGSARGPSSPNFSVFDNWIHEPAFLAGMIGAAISENQKLGVVAGMEIDEINRLVNAFISGAKELRPDVEVRIEFINDFHNPEKAAEKTKSLIKEGVDFIYAERDGVIPVCENMKIPVIGNIIDQSKSGQNFKYVVSSVVWNLSPTIDRVIDQIRHRTYQAEDYGSWSRMFRKGSELSPFPLEPRWRDKINKEDLQTIDRFADEIRRGVYRVQILEIDPLIYSKLQTAPNFSSKTKVAQFDEKQF